MKVVFFHRNKSVGYSINKVTQTIVRNVLPKQECYAPFAGASFRSIIRNLFFVWKMRDRNAINHITGDIHYCMLALIGCKSVLTIHDTVTLDFCHMSKYKSLIIEWLWFRLPLIISTKVVCISEETRRQVQKYTNRDDIEVIHNAVDPIFEYSPPHFSEDVSKILLIGTSQNKNLIRTFEALRDLKCKVTIIGELNDCQKKALQEYHIDYVNKVGLSDEQLVNEYKKCDIVSFISLFEGFGMIVIEANKVGRPVICSNIPVLKEVAGDAAFFVNPFDVEEMRKGFKQLISDKTLCLNLIERGCRNVQRFDVEVIQQKWENLYTSII